MADEIAQVVQVEMQGMTMAIKGSVQMAEWFINAMKALMDYRSDKKGQRADRKAERKKKRIESPGEKGGIAEIMELSKGMGVPQVVNVPEKYLQEFLELATKNGARYCRLVDFDTNDGLKPLFFPPQDLVVVQEILKYVNEKAKNELNADKADVEDTIRELFEKFSYAEEGEKKELQKRIGMLEEAKDEMDDLLGKNELLVNGGAVMSFQDYLLQARGTEFEKDPDKAVSELEKGVEIGKEIPLAACLQPVRYADNDSRDMAQKTYYYISESDSVIERDTYYDKGVAYSSFRVVAKSGEIYEVSDKNLTNTEWNEEMLPLFLNKIGALEHTKCRVFDSEEKLEAYLKYHNQVKPKSEENIGKLREEGKEVFSSADVRAEVDYALSQNLKARASATWYDYKIEFAIPQDKITISNGKLRAELEDGDAIIFLGIQAEGVENGKCYFTVGQNDEIFLEKRDDNAGDVSLVKTSAAAVKESMQRKEQANAALQRNKAKEVGR